ncbi:MULTISPECIES: sialic acid TRAP transporter substrate-binding protein SiaP [unclassified Aminobacter]|uniref:sialic acid TRAP transporter substrate-binding protein SiaP n=1 Tax=unclassified Aminobacter TaxID=2644704 RepID=UPI0004BA4E67|nr:MULTISPECIES: sialic acid TRAP transporter substrate-binding protein SiaP [unclassified Aminobacter]TWH28670.1 TRAP-type C4-dicarboxylate transport system substrate-binding protein [Aminobacter sp. J15]
MNMTRRIMLAVGASLLFTCAAAAETIKLRFADSTTADAPRSRALVEIFAKRLGDEFVFEPYFASTLYKQGTEIVAVQRGNLELALMPPSDFAKQVPAFSILTAAYLVRDAAHLKAIFNSEIGDEFKKMARDEMGIVVLAPAYYGTRHVNLKGDKKIEKPEDLAGIKLRMPGGEAWQFLGESIGANPVALDYAEVYTGLQTGAIDAQDNPLPNNKLMKFHEVTDQIVLTGHNVGFGLLLISAKLFDSLTPEQQKRMQEAADEAFAWSDAEYIKQEEELIEYFKGEGLEVYTPDVEAFRAYANKKYLESPLSKDWPEGMLEKINAL